MQDAIRSVLRIIHALAAIMWAGAIAFAAYRVYQLCTLRAVQAEVLKAETDSYLETDQEEDSDGFRRQYTHRVYRAEALVRYQYQGKQYTAMTHPDTWSGFKFVADAQVNKWRPGTRIRVHIAPGQPERPKAGLGLTLNTFWMSIVLTAFGFLWVGMGYAVKRMAAFLTRVMGG